MKESTKIERLWAPWRLEHVKKYTEPSTTCVFCDLALAKCDSDSLKLYQSKYCFVTMNRFPYNPYHLMVIPNDHCGMLTALTGEIWTDFQRCLKASVDLLMNVVKPQGMNLGINMGKAGGASIHEHLHFHVLPRWAGDTNFMPILAEAKNIPVHNLSVFEELSGPFQNFEKYLSVYR